MKVRILISMVLVTALALPVIATVSRFPDVPADHQHADAIRWASDPEQHNGAALFRGFPDGNFGPDQELTENQFSKVVARLFDTYDRWTRAETAALLYYGFRGLNSNTSTTTQPVVTETTTTTIQPQNPDPQLQVAIHLENEDDYYLHIHWLRPGWENQIWQWRLHTSDSNCRFPRGYSSWQNGWHNHWTYRKPLCVYTDNWQVEIIWENGERFISEPCVLRDNSWDCNTPSDWRSWTQYPDVPPVITYKSIEFHSESAGFTTYNLIFTSNRRTNIYMVLCDRVLLAHLEKGDNQFKVTCRSELDKSQLIVFHWVYSNPPDDRYVWEDVGARYYGQTLYFGIIENELVSLPKNTDTNTQLNPQRLNPQIKITQIIDDDFDDYFDIEIKATLDNPELARNVTIYESSSLHLSYPLVIMMKDLIGENNIVGVEYCLPECVNYIHYKKVVDDGIIIRRLTKEEWNELVANETMIIVEIHEPGAASHHLSFIPDEIL